jgi:hypothetical protein
MLSSRVRSLEAILKRQYFASKRRRPESRLQTKMAGRMVGLCIRECRLEYNFELGGLSDPAERANVTGTSHDLLQELPKRILLVIAIKGWMPKIPNNEYTHVRCPMDCLSCASHPRLKYDEGTCTYACRSLQLIHDLDRFLVVFGAVVKVQSPFL